MPTKWNTRAHTANGSDWDLIDKSIQFQVPLDQGEIIREVRCSGALSFQAHGAVEDNAAAAVPMRMYWHLNVTIWAAGFLLYSLKQAGGFFEEYGGTLWYENTAPNSPRGSYGWVWSTPPGALDVHATYPMPIDNGAGSVRFFLSVYPYFGSFVSLASYEGNPAGNLQLSVLSTYYSP